MLMAAAMPMINNTSKCVLAFVAIAFGKWGLNLFTRGQYQQGMLQLQIMHVRFQVPNSIRRLHPTENKQLKE